MKNKKNERVGETRRNKQGLTMRIVAYLNSKNMIIEFLETGERKKAQYVDFCKGAPVADLLKYPHHGECSFTQAKWITVGMIALAAGAFAAMIYAIL